MKYLIIVETNRLEPRDGRILSSLQIAFVMVEYLCHKNSTTKDWIDLSLNCFLATRVDFYNLTMY